MDRKNAAEFDQQVLDLYDDYVHGRIARRDFAQRVGKYLAAGQTTRGFTRTI